MTMARKKKCCYYNAVIDTLIAWWVCIAVSGLLVKVLVGVGYRGDFCEKRPGAASVADTASSSQLQNGHSAGQI